MTVKTAFDLWDLAKSVVKECLENQKRECFICQKIDQVLHEILVGEDIIKHFDLYYENEELDLISLYDPQLRKDASQWNEEVKKRIRFIRENKGGEELPEEITEIFFRLEKAIKRHTPVD